MSLDLPEGPFFIPPHTSESGGVDFLGLRQVNLNYMSTCLPGINNVTTYIRPFSLISWMYWKVYNLIKDGNAKNVTNELIENYCEKVETLFTWGHIIRNVSGIPGTQSRPTVSRGKKVSLLFKDWKRVKRNTSILAAVNYGPASKTIAGLSFIDPVARNIYRTCGIGIKLAEEFDKQLRKRKSYKVLDDLMEIYGSEADADDLYEAWSILNPSKIEKDLFMKSFFDKNEIGKDTLIGERSSTLELLFTSLRGIDGQIEVNDLRKVMAYGLYKNKKISISAELKNAQYKWLLLQIRQAQRFAFEWLFSWLESRVLDYNEKDIESISKSAMLSIEKYPEILKKGRDLESTTKFLNNHETIEELLLDSNKNATLCVFNLIDQFQESDTDEIIVPLTLRIILVCHHYAEVFIKQGIMREELNWGGADRISLNFLKNTINGSSGFSVVYLCVVVVPY